MKLTKTVRMFGIVATLLGAVATKSFALPANEIETTYFSDSTYSNEVGYMFRACQGGVYREGQTSRYRVTLSTPCHTSGPIEMACYFEGRLTACPLNICDTELVTCIYPTFP